ncbi:H-NS histone family protein [Burkholderia pyrrocinia]|uniref:H-NS histone family protein n=1 Tax=Burkholderia pyrrocinia TaxID=60550 RepID=UPI00157715D8|nr:H-NS histone family protein [Burkholderia pyrrocinia]NTX26643.1 H-NS histone family protein [Burkholderia pyrrocinia]QVN23408.1 H-NS histone family protein [Burkholderia pyrrocinia]
MMTYKELLDERERLAARIEAARAEELGTVIDDIRQKMVDYGITFRDIDPQRGRKHRPAPQPKYRNPATGATWSGRGRPPGWIVGQDWTLYKIA